VKLNFNLLLPTLLIIASTPAFGALSDATGLVNRFDIETGGHQFEITTTSNFDVQRVDFDKDQKHLTFHIVSSLENNLGEIIIPRGLLSGNFTFLLNDQDFIPKLKTNDKISFITLNFTGSGPNQLDVFATKYLEDLDKTTPIIKQDSEINETSPDNLVEGGGCLIATATFGSELSPQVQNLRELRDNKILQTKIGAEFMHDFNNFYYSFSPSIADLERENPTFKEGVKIAITPMLFSLSLLNDVDIKSEFDVVGYGLSVIFLNIGMYFAGPALLILKASKR